MRSQLLLLSIISLAVAGCGKSVDRSAQAVGQAGTPGGVNVSTVQLAPPETAAGACADPIETNFQKVDRFSDLAMRAGSYELASFQGVGSATQASARAISVVSGAVAEGGTLEYTEICRDMNAMPTGSFTWNVTAPNALDAVVGAISEDLRLGQTVSGPGVRNAEGQPQSPTRFLTIEPTQGCTSADAAIEGSACAPATFYRIDSKTIGVLRTVDSLVGDMNVRSKIFAKYTLVGNVLDDAPVPSDNDGSWNKKGKGKGKGEQGDGDQGSSKQGKVSKPNTKANANANANANKKANAKANGKANEANKKANANANANANAKPGKGNGNQGADGDQGSSSSTHSASYTQTHSDQFAYWAANSGPKRASAPASHVVSSSSNVVTTTTVKSTSSSTVASSGATHLSKVSTVNAAAAEGEVLDASIPADAKKYKLDYKNKDATGKTKLSVKVKR